MIKVLTLTIGMKFDPIVKNHEQLRTVQNQQISELDAHLEDGWTVLHVSDIADQHGWHSLYTIRKPTSEIELDAMLQNTRLGESAPTDDEFAMFRRKSEDDSTC
ncbi:MAG: hypothetical protein IT322_21240 [Anaerolineae bacterium]|nr:hypothetical protein [Anaerolineae bacterium]